MPPTASHRRAAPSPSAAGHTEEGQQRHQAVVSSSGSCGGLRGLLDRNRARLEQLTSRVHTLTQEVEACCTLSPAPPSTTSDAITSGTTRGRNPFSEHGQRQHFPPTQHLLTQHTEGMSVCSPESQGVRGGYLSCDEALSGLLSHSPDSTAHGGRGRGRVLFQEEGEETHACMATLYAQVASLSSISSSPHPSLSPTHSPDHSAHTDQSKTHSSLSAITHEEEETEEEEEEGEKQGGEAQCGGWGGSGRRLWDQDESHTAAVLLREARALGMVRVDAMLDYVHLMSPIHSPSPTYSTHSPSYTTRGGSNDNRRSEQRRNDNPPSSYLSQHTRDQGSYHSTRGERVRGSNPPSPSPFKPLSPSPYKPRPSSFSPSPPLDWRSADVSPLTIGDSTIRRRPLTIDESTSPLMIGDSTIRRRPLTIGDSSLRRRPSLTIGDSTIPRRSEWFPSPGNVDLVSPTTTTATLSPYSPMVNRPFSPKRDKGRDKYSPVMTDKRRGNKQFSPLRTDKGQRCVRCGGKGREGCGHRQREEEEEEAPSPRLHAPTPTPIPVQHQGGRKGEGRGLREWGISNLRETRKGLFFV